MKSLIFKTLFFIFTYSGNIFSYIQSIDVWRHPTTNKLIYGAADHHDLSANDPKNRVCSDALRNVIAYDASSRVHSSFMVVEDIVEYSGENVEVKAFQQLLLQRNGRSPLVGLASYAQTKGYVATGVDHRFMRVAGIYRGTYGDKQYCAVGAISGRAMVDEYCEAMACVKHYEDSQLYTYYQQVIDSIKTPYNKWFMTTYFAEKNEDVADLFAHMDSMEERSSVSMHFLTFDMRLVDARALHLVAQSCPLKDVFLFLGARHLANMKTVLENELGYVCIKHVGDHYAYPLEPIDGVFFEREENKKDHAPLTLEELNLLGKKLDQL